MSNLAKVSNFFTASRINATVKANTVVLDAPIRRVRRTLKRAGVAFSGHWVNKHLNSITVPAGKGTVVIKTANNHTVVSFQ